MEFNHQPYQKGETIAAIATPPGLGGIAIIRISGNCARKVASQIFSGPVFNFESHTAHFGKIFDKSGEVIDKVLLLVFLGSRSFTGEETIEIHCHGGTISAKKILGRIFELGVRGACPGEFSFKAFMNGKIDLAQAESIQEMISAKNERAFHLAQQLLEGALSKKIKLLQEEITKFAAIFEAWVDFPEEGLEFATLEEMERDLQRVIKTMDEMLATYDEGRKVSAGLHLSIVGAPNVGKSSLMNALLQKERAIVTPIAGTTRDILEEDLHLNGLHFRLIDTAGIRETDDIVEREGILRSHKAIEGADIVLFVLDATKNPSQEEITLFHSIPEAKRIAVWNKIDVMKNDPLYFAEGVKISAMRGVGLKDLKKKIDHLIWANGKADRGEVVISHLRHYQALAQARESLHTVSANMHHNFSPEFLVFDLRQSLFHLGTILGTNVSEDILSSIFSQFCIGK